MAKIVLYIATSLDGYIARTNGGIDWLSIVERTGEDYGYAAFYESVDAVVMGSKTYELCLGFSEWPYPGKKAYVLTQRKLKSDRADVVFVSRDAGKAHKEFKAQGLKNVWLVGGGAITGAFLQQGLIDEFIISVIPIILGDGIRLFPSPGPEAQLELVDSRSYPSGLVQAHYRRRPNR
jgi:dihydrofolate reductase